MKTQNISDVIYDLSTLERTCKHGKNSIRKEVLHDAIEYLKKYQAIGYMLEEIIGDTVWSLTDEDAR